MGKALVIVESPAKARTIGGMLGPDFIVESSVGHIRDLPRGADEVPAALQGRVVGAPRGRRRQRLQAALRDLVAEEVGRGQPQEAPQGRRRAVPRHGRGPRGRVDRVAPLRGAVAHRARQAHGVPRDHAGGHRPRRRRVARPRPPPGRRAGGAAHPRPPLRLRGVAGPLAQGHAAALGRPGPERRHPHGGRAGAGPHALPLRDLVGRRGHLHPHAARRRASARPWWLWAGRRSPPARTSTSTGSRPARATSGCSARTRPPRSPPRWPGSPSP